MGVRNGNTTGRYVDSHQSLGRQSTSIHEVPVTELRKPFQPNDSDILYEFGTARANVAATRDQPQGTTEDDYTSKRQHRTVLQQHCDYWDTDGDGVIWPLDTYSGCRRFGWNPVLSLIAMFIINSGLSYPTCPTLLPDPFFRIWLDRVHKAKHGSDSNTYDTEGRFRPQQFEDIFAKYDADNDGVLSLKDVFNLWNGQRTLMDMFGMAATCFEWIAVYLVIWPEDNLLHKEDVRGIFDGSIFYKKEAEVKRQKEEKSSKKAQNKMRR